MRHDRTTWIHLLLVTMAFGLMEMSRVSAQETTVAVADAVDDEPARDQAELDADIASFDQVWETIRDRNWDEDFDLQAWQEVRNEMRPQVEASKNIGETRQVMSKLIASLGKSHYGIIPSELYDKIKTVKEEKAEKEKAKNEEEDGDDEEEEVEGEAGLSVRLVDGEALVIRVEPGSSAEEAGIQPGWIVKKFKDQDVAELYEELKAELPPTSPMRPDTLAALALEGKIAGDVGETIDLTFLDGNDSEQEITLGLKPRTGKIIQFGHLPEMQVKSVSKVVESSIGYVWFSVFFDPVTVMKDMKTAVKTAEGGKGFILDVRGNHGGLAGMTMGVGNHFVKDKKSFLGTLSTKENDLKFALIPRAKPYKGPVAVLVDECSISSAEILAGGLQAIGRAKVFGIQTAGLALPSTVELLPNNDRFQFAIAGYLDSEGRNIEGTGVTPDETVSPNRQALLEGADPILDAAVAWINEQAGE